MSYSRRSGVGAQNAQCMRLKTNICDAKEERNSWLVREFSGISIRRQRNRQRKVSCPILRGTFFPNRRGRFPQTPKASTKIVHVDRTRRRAHFVSVSDLKRDALLSGAHLHRPPMLFAFFQINFFLTTCSPLTPL